FPSLASAGSLRGRANANIVLPDRFKRRIYYFASGGWTTMQVNLALFRGQHNAAAALALFAIFTTGLLPAASWAQEASLNSYVEAVRTEYGLPALAAAVVKEGKVIAAAATGTRVYGQDIPVTIDDRFHLGSNTKSMTATLAGMLVEEGKLSWDSNVGDVLGDAVKGMKIGRAHV